MKKLIAFDLDDTLAISKSPISDQMSELLGRLLENFEVCVISGGKYEQFQIQVVDRLHAPENLLNRLHLMPTCGTRYYRYDSASQAWEIRYAEDLGEVEKRRIIDVSEKTAKAMDMWPAKPYGEVIEDRLSQISISMLGQEAPPEEKDKWAERYSAERMRLRDAIAEKIPEFEVRAGGKTTIDITRIGIDKAYGMEKLIQELEISKNDILFFGDKLSEGGNDYPVKAMGIDCLEVSDWRNTAQILTGILHVL